MHVRTWLWRSQKGHRAALLGVLLAILVIFASKLMKPVWLKWLIDAIEAHQVSELWKICFAFAVLELSMIVSWSIFDYCMMHYELGVRRQLTQQVLASWHGKDLAEMDQVQEAHFLASFGDLFDLTTWSVNFLFRSFLYSLLVLMGSLLFLMTVSWHFSLMMLLWVMAFMGIFIAMQESMAQHAVGCVQARARLMSVLADGLFNRVHVKVFLGVEREHQKGQHAYAQFALVFRKQSYFMMIFYSFLGLITVAYSIGIMFALVHAQQMGLVRAGDVALVLMTVMNLISMMYDFTHDMQTFIQNWGKLRQALATLAIDAPQELVVYPKSLEEAPLSIVYENVSFHYPRKSCLFEDLSFAIHPKEKVGIVGYSGAGKSTLVHLLLRLYQPSAGRILLRGQDIRSMSEEALRSEITFMSQETVLFEDSFLENIRYGVFDATEEAVQEAARKALIHDFILATPQGYHTKVASKGQGLSGGQRQRVLLARAFLRPAECVVLDEATSHLDALIEQDVQASLWQFMEEKTVMVIAHRLSTLLRMDRILVFESGRLVQQGPHHELIETPGLYAKMWHAQSHGYLPLND